ncbi:MAG: hypothetical protein HY291_15195 [Planctomycetes bacterium]|nr:hypothetical protein [Planctomycetota bacterium]
MNRPARMGLLAGVLLLALPLGLARSAEDEKSGAAAAPAESAKTEAKSDAGAKDAPKAGAMPAFPLTSKYFDKIVDGYSPDDQPELVEIPLEAMGDVLAALKNCSDEHLRANLDATANFKLLMKDPEKYRGHVVELAGVLRFMRKVGLENNVSGVNEAWQGQISNAEGFITTFISMEPLGEDLKINQGVRVTGVFLKRYGYLNRAPGEQLQICPLIFVKHLEPWSELKHTTVERSWSMIIMDALLALLAVAVLVGLLYSRSMNKTKAANVFTKKKERTKPAEGNFPKPEKPEPLFPKPDSDKA